MIENDTDQINGIELISKMTLNIISFRLPFPCGLLQAKSQRVTARSGRTLFKKEKNSFCTIEKNVF